MLEKGIYSGDETLSEVVGKDRFAKLDKQASEMGIPDRSAPSASSPGWPP